MHVKRFSMRHLGHLRGWMSLRKMDLIHLDNLPEIGFIAFEGPTALAVAFLRQIEGGYACLDVVVSNPEVSAKCRLEALQATSIAALKRAVGMRLVEWTIVKM